MKLRWPLSFSFYDMRDSLWYRPAMMTLAAFLLSLVTVQLDVYLFDQRAVELPLLFQGGAEGARGVLSAISSTMITVATTAFSVTLVALQLGSSQFSPRILRSFTGDPGNQLVLGIFMATFAFSLSVLRSVRSETASYEGFVPTISVTVAIIMAFTAIGSLIYFFHHATRTIQAPVVIDRTFSDFTNVIQRTYERQNAGNRRVLQQDMNLPESFDRLLLVKCDKAGYLRDPDVERAIAVASQNKLVLHFHRGVGEYLNPGMPIATIWRHRDDKNADRDGLNTVADDVRGCFDYGLERTLEYDPLFGMQQLSDIALLALSPGTNDPSTAHNVLDRLGTTLIDVERICGSQLVCAEDEGTVRVLYPITSFEEFARLAFDQIRHYGAADPLIVSHALQTLQQAAAQVTEENAALLCEIANEVWEGADRSRWIAADNKRVNDAATWATGAGTNQQPERFAPAGQVHSR